MSANKMNVAIAGLGRMGKRHALNFLNRTPRAAVVAAFTPDASERRWAEEKLVPFGVTVYSDFDRMLQHSGLQAVVIATVTTVHAEQANKAIARDLHVLVEKPISTSVEVSQSVVDAAAAKPHLKVLCGFSRRFDASYREAYARAASGDIGVPSIFRSQTCDKLDPSGFFVAYAAFSGGIFVDCNIHDIDLALWFLSTPSADGSVRRPVVKSAYAVGITAISPALKQHGDVDNGIGVVEFWGGKVAYFYSSRMMAAGQHDMSEIIGTKGKLTVNAAPSANLVEMHESTGIRREIPADYYGRFQEAFVTEANEWTQWILENRKGLPGGLTLDTAVRAVAIGAALQESLRSGKKIIFDESGVRKTERALDQAQL